MSRFGREYREMIAELEAFRLAASGGDVLLRLTFPPAIVTRLNELVAASHWKRHQLVDEAHDAMGFSVREQLGAGEIIPCPFPVEVTVWAYGVNPRDADASFKITLDVMEKMRVIESDGWRHVTGVHGYTRKCKKSDEKIVVLIRKAQSEVQE